MPVNIATAQDNLWSKETGSIVDKDSIESAIEKLILSIEGKVRNELKDTPNRVYRSYLEIFDGYNIDTKKLLSSHFEQEGSDMIVGMRDIKFHSCCEHHLLNFSGSVSIAYLPANNRVIGASKMDRLVLAYAHRLQIQERMTRQIANDIMKYLEPRGVAVIAQASHLCMRCRGVKSPTSEMFTSAMFGEFRENWAMRMEVLSLLGLRGPA